MAKSFYSKPIPVLGNVAMLILCVVFFLIPFAGRGARLALDEMVNNVADWLPSHYQETKELEEFRKYFLGGSHFVMLSGPWCREDNGAYINLKRKIYEESLDYEKELIAQGRNEELRARRLGDKLGLLYTGSYKEDWGEQKERWLQGKDKQWYFINRLGQLYRWDGQENIAEAISRTSERMRNGKNKAVGTYIDRFGVFPNDKEGIENEFYKDPRKLCCRPFQSVISGPDVFEQMAGENGSLRVLKMGESDRSTFQAKVEAHNRLTGSLFGPTPEPSFAWTFESLLQHVDDERKSVLLADPIYRGRFEDFINQKVEEEFAGDRDKLLSAISTKQLEIWYQLWFQLELDPPPRLTCLVVTLNSPIIKELARAVGRPLMGKPRGRLLELATGEVGILPKNLHIGGPPSDNVAIDEEGTITLVNLIGLSAVIGISLAYISFRNVWITLMLFFTGGVGAMASLSYVWFGGDKMDAILMSMPSLIYVLGLSGAVHIVNYYRDACHEHGPDLAAERAIGHSFMPCTIAAFTTALGLASLVISNLAPISKFGKYSAIATMGTVVILFTFLPAALTMFRPGYRKLTEEERARGGESGLAEMVTRFWSKVGDVVIRYYAICALAGICVIVTGAYGILTKIDTQVHLLKMFDEDAKILVDYRWLEKNLGKLVPAEIVVSIDPEAQQEVYKETLEKEAAEQQKQQSGPDAFAIQASGGEASSTSDSASEPLVMTQAQQQEYSTRLSMLERVQLSNLVRTNLELFFGPDGLDIVGSGMSSDVFIPLNEFASSSALANRLASAHLYKNRPKILGQDYLAVAEKGRTRPAEQIQGQELWRISIRLAALSNVDYGRFINDMKSVVEPINNAYRYRKEILRTIQASVQKNPKLTDPKLSDAKVIVLGGKPKFTREDLVAKAAASGSELVGEDFIDQTLIFSSALRQILADRGIENRSGEKTPRLIWVDPEKYDPKNPNLSDSVRKRLEKFFEKQSWQKYLETRDCVILVEDHELFDADFIQQHAKNLVDCRDHQFLIDPATKAPMAGMKTATERKLAGEDVEITTIYTGIIPIVYKAQRALLGSLIESIGLAFVMITGVMMLLLRDWQRPFEKGNRLNVRGGLLAMIPNVFPVVVVFGYMGFCGIKVDIGSMMTASVAMGVAVDDTIHFLTWYGQGLRKGLGRIGAIKLAYQRVATAMTQTTLIAGFGLAAFAFSTFTPTQRFGTLMLFLLAAALVGDLMILPAVLASPLGKYFSKIPIADQRPLGPAQAAGTTGTDPADDEIKTPATDGQSGGEEHTFRLIDDEAI